MLAVLVVLAGAGWGAVALLGGDEPDPTPTAAPLPSPEAPNPTPETSQPDPSAPPSPSSGPTTPESLDDLLAEGGLDDLLGEGGLEDLLGEGGLEDLLGEGGLDDLLGGAMDQELLQCLTPEGAQPSMEGTTLPDDPAEAIRAIADQVAQLRDLEFSDPVELDLLSSRDLSDRVVDLTDEDYPVEDSDVDQAILEALGQIGDGVDLRATYLDLLGEQVAGFYDPETGELVAESAGDLAPSDRIIVAHELDHALTDQALGLPELVEEGDGQDDIDALLAQQALVEGDATVLMQQWAAAHLSLVDQFSLAAPGVETQALDAAPYVLQQQLLYPYEDGLAFVCSQYVDGGWAAVDAMYDDLPTTTAQVLFPERYAAGEEAVEVTVPSLPDATELRSTTFGAAELAWLLEAPGDDPSAGPDDATDLAADWAGGRQVVWDADGDTVLALRFAQQPDGQLCASLARWHGAAFPEADSVVTEGAEANAWEGGGRAGTLTCADDVVTAVVGPDLATVREVG